MNEDQFRQLLTFDKPFANRAIVFDSTGVGGQTNNGGAWLIPYLSDSTLFLDFDSKSLLVLTSNGKIGRVTAAPITNQMVFVGQRTTGVDALETLIYRGNYIR